MNLNIHPTKKLFCLSVRNEPKFNFFATTKAYISMINKLFVEYRLSGMGMDNITIINIIIIRRTCCATELIEIHPLIRIIMLSGFQISVFVLMIQRYTQTVGFSREHRAKWILIHVLIILIHQEGRLLCCYSIFPIAANHGLMVQITGCFDHLLNIIRNFDAHTQTQHKYGR